MDNQNLNNENVTVESANVESTTVESASYVDASSNTYQSEVPVYDASSFATEEPKQSNALAIVGLVFGILSLVLCCCGCFGIISGIAGLVCSIIANKKNPTGIAKAGIICSAIGLGLCVIITILSWVGALGDYSSALENMTY